MTAAYPHTPHWPASPALATVRSTARVHQEPDLFLHVPVVITEKLDGTNVALTGGRVLDRSGHPAEGRPWLAMARKHHAWRTAGPAMAHLTIHGEDLYAVHAIEYGPLPKDGTLRVFATSEHGHFHDFDRTIAIASAMELTMVPLLHHGTFSSREELQRLLDRLQKQPSVLGGQREGLVIRRRHGFPAQDFAQNVAKSVRASHVRPDQAHWRRNWRPCAMLPPARG